MLIKCCSPANNKESKQRPVNSIAILLIGLDNPVPL